MLYVFCYRCSQRNKTHIVVSHKKKRWNIYKLYMIYCNFSNIYLQFSSRLMNKHHISAIYKGRVITMKDKALLCVRRFSTSATQSPQIHKWRKGPSWGTKLHSWSSIGHQPNVQDNRERMLSQVVCLFAYQLCWYNIALLGEKCNAHENLASGFYTAALWHGVKLVSTKIEKKNSE